MYKINYNEAYKFQEGCTISLNQVFIASILAAYKKYLKVSALNILTVVFIYSNISQLLIYELEVKSSKIIVTSFFFKVIMQKNPELFTMDLIEYKMCFRDDKSSLLVCVSAT